MAASKIALTISVILILGISLTVVILSAIILAEINKSKSSTTTQSPTVAPSVQPVPSGWQTVSEIFLASIDRSRDPCDDFYAFACNKYVQGHDENSNWFADAQNRTNTDAKAALKNVDDQGKTTDKTLISIKKLFLACEKDMKQTGARAEKIDEMASEFGDWPVLDQAWDWTANVPRRFQNFEYTIGWLFSRYQVPSLLESAIAPDQFGVYRLIIFGPTATVGKCPKDSKDPIWAKLGDLMSTTITRLAAALSIDLDADKMQRDVNDMVQFEQTLCQIQKTPSRSLVSVDQAKVRWPNIDWEQYLQAVLVDLYRYQNISAQVRTGFFIQSPDYITELDRKFLPQYTSTTSNVRIFQNYLLWRLVIEYVQVTQPLVGPAWDRFVRASRAKRPPRIGFDPPSHREYALSDDQCLDLVNRAATFAVGRAYIDFKYGPEGGWALRKRIVSTLRNVLFEFRAMLKANEWLDDESKQNALIKVDYIIENAVNQEFAFEDEELDDYYSYVNDIVLDTAYEDVFDTAMAIQQHKQSVLFSLIGRNGTRRTSWGNDDCQFCYAYNPLSVNAWYLMNRNSMTIPAAIVQTPFYGADFPYAVNYGALAMVIGHEVTHGFNDHGQGYDKDGKPHPWITSQSQDQFNTRAQCVNDQFSQFCYNFSDGTMCVNGEKTEDENLADNGGIKSAYGAYLASRPPTEQPIPGLEDFSMDQIFFLSFAESWCAKTSDESVEASLQYDVHSPGPDRVRGALQNFPAFGKVWNCKKGDKMYPDKPCIVW